MKDLITYLLESYDYWNNKYISKDEILKLCNKALQENNITASIINDEISKYKDIDHLYNAYENDKLENYKKFEKSLIVLLKNNNYMNEILEDVFNNIYDLVMDLE